MTGSLLLVVGPSGAGKDSILRYAMKSFSGDERVVFPRRCITRIADARIEDHETIEERAFDSLLRQGAFALSWEAHGLKYGVRRDIDEHLSCERVVVVNVSRTIVEKVASSYPLLIVAEISACAETRARRIAARGRESRLDILRRIGRQTPSIPMHVRVQKILNDGLLSQAGEDFCSLIASLVPAHTLLGKSNPRVANH